jgi:hypothetical protein
MSDEYSRTVKLSDDLSYVPPTAPLPSWLKGFFVTTMQHGEDAVVKAAVEASNILNDYWFKMAYDAHRLDGEKPYDKAEAMWIPGVDHCAFVALRPDDNDVNVYLVGKAIIEECRTGADWKQPTSVCRIVPVEKTASELDFERLANEMCAKHFPKRSADEEPITFEVHYEEHGALHHLRASDVNRTIAKYVPNVGYEVDLKNPKYTIVCINAGGSFMMSVVEQYDALRHFNVHTAVHEKLSDTVPASSQPAA